MKLFNRKKAVNALSVQTAEKSGAGHPFSALSGYVPLTRAELSIYSALREGVPIIDAALGKLVRLLGSFVIESENKGLEREMNEFLKTVRVNGTSSGIMSFIYTYFDQLLTFGTAVGEVVPDISGRDIAMLYNAPLDNIELKLAENGVDPIILTDAGIGTAKPAENPELICLTLLDPQAGSLKGNSILRGLPFVSEILLKIFQSIGNNWERVGNVRFAVTYKPSGDSSLYAKENAEQIASEWTKAMRDKRRTCDFVSVGDVDIKVIGADNQVLDSEVPVRQLLEQITAKLGIPPFLLGLSWSSTERMSAQQADILTSEIDHYRRILEPAIMKICNIWQSFNGYRDGFDIVWNNISLQDETELAQARYVNAQAESLEMHNATQRKIESGEGNI